MLDGETGARDVQQRDRQAVGDHVVQLAGDPCPLLGAGALGQAGLSRPQLRRAACARGCPVPRAPAANVTPAIHAPQPGSWRAHSHSPANSDELAIQYDGAQADTTGQRAPGRQHAQREPADVARPTAEHERRPRPRSGEQRRPQPSTLRASAPDQQPAGAERPAPPPATLAPGPSGCRSTRPMTANTTSAPEAEPAARRRMTVDAR